MGSRWSQRARLAYGLTTILAGAGMSAGCMEARPAINRVQPDFLDKTQLIPVQYDLLTRAGRTPQQLTREDLRREPIWAHQITIIDKPATTGQQGISWYTDMERINWEVTEGFLIARRAYDRLLGAENVTGRANPRSEDNNTGIASNPRQGEILAVYRIQSHFDIRRSYNPQTGEELNVVEENGSDRPWYQRKYMRVDWTQNLVGGYSAMSYAEWTGSVRAEPTPVYINDPTDPNAPVFNYETRNNQANTLTYFDVTNRMTLHPEEVNLAQWGYPNLPACVISDTGIESCQPADVHFRVSFMRLDTSRDYEAQQIDGLRMDRFGFFEGGRLGYNNDRQEILNTDRRHFAFRHNLWKNHHMPRTAGATGLAGGVLGSGDMACTVRPGEAFATECQGMSRTAECVATQGSTTGVCVDRYALCRQDSDCAGQDRGARCDTGASYYRGDGNGVCLLPYRDRDVRPIPYHLSPNYPDRIMPVTNTIVRDWNRAFSDAVGQARRRECILDPNVGDKTTCDAYLAFNAEQRESDTVVTAQGAMLPNGRPQDAQWVYVGCHNPVWGTDPNLPGAHTQAEVDAARNSGWDTDACGPQGTVARLGDIRYSMIASINEYDRQGSWGLANISGDPETGEVYSARGAVWQTVTDLQSNQTIDMLRVLNGEITPDQIANGESIREIYPGLGENAGRQARGGQGAVPGSNLPAMRSHVRAPQSMDEVNNLVRATSMDHLDMGHEHQEPTATGAEQGVRAGAGVASINDLARDPSTGRLTETNFRANGMQRWNRTGVSPIIGSGQNDLATRLQRIRGTELEDRMMNNAQLALGGQDPRVSGVLPSAREAASPARNWNLRMRQIRTEIDRVASQHQCNMEHDPVAAYDDTELRFYLSQFKANRVPYGLTFGKTWDFTTGAGDGGINWASAREWLVQYIHYPVMLHELGHSIGQRHNFASSADAFNYNDRYWALRAQRHGGDSRMIRPRWEYTAAGQPEFTQDEQDNGEEALAYSSIMDYKTTEGAGLGRYDFAFVMHGYVNMVEAFKEVANRDRALNLFQTYSGAGQQPLSFGLAGDQNNLRLTSFHYTEIPAVVGTSMRTVEVHPGVNVTGNLPNLTQANRFPVFLDETNREAYNAFTWDPDHTNQSLRGPDGATGQFLLVPYRFETDDYAGTYWYNSRYDAGADFYEVMRYFGSRYLDYYPFASFGRERASFTISGYVGRMQSRYLDNMYYIMRVAAIYENFYRNIFAAVTNYNEWKTQTASVAQALGTSTVFDTFMTALTMPEWNRFGATFSRRVRPEDGSTFYDETGFGQRARFEMPIGEGRQYQSTWDYASGRFWRERLVNAGSYYDKVTALQYMTDTFIYSVNRDLDQDLRSYQVNVYTVYPGQTLRLFGSILSEDNPDIGPIARVTGNTATMQRTQLALLNLPAGTGPGTNGRVIAGDNIPVNPNLGFTTTLYSAIFGMAGLSASYDQRFIQSARLWADGDPFAAELPAGQTVTFRDPVTGLTYRAIKHTTPTVGATNLDPGVSAREAARPMAADGTNYPGERGIAARMILRANDLLRYTATPGLQPAERNAAFARLQQYVDLLNVMRLLNSRYGTGGQVAGNNSFTGSDL